MKKLVSFILSFIIVLTMVVSVSALDIASDNGIYYMAEGMKGIYVSSSNCPAIKDKPGSSVFFDHDKNTGYTFSFSEEDSKVVTVYAASRDCEITDRYAFIASLPEGAEITVTVYGTDDASLKEWTALTSNAVDEESEYKAFDLADMEKGYAFYRFDFELTAGTEFTLSELSLLTAHITAPDSEDVKKGGTLIEREPWRMVKGIFSSRHRISN